MASRTVFKRLILQFERDLLTRTHLKTLVEPRLTRTRVDQACEEMTRSLSASKKR